MKSLLPIVTTVEAAIILFCMYMLYRNTKVYKFRIWVLKESHPDIKQRLANHTKLPDYNTMMWQLTRFDWSDYLK